jgi:hypothetical protein
MRIGLIFCVLFFAGCAARPTVTEHQCRAGDWHTIGYRDSRQGLLSTQLLPHQEACGEYGIYLAREDYMAGWNDGLAEYCTSDNGFTLGRRGANHQSLCTSDDFTLAYQDGRRLYEENREVTLMQREIDGVEQRLVNIRQELIGATTAQLAPDLTTQHRIRLLAKVESLYTERTRLKSSLPRLEVDFQDSEDRLQALSQSLAYAYESEPR